MKSVIAFMPDLFPPAAVVCVQPPVFDDPQQIAHLRAMLSKCAELQGLRIALAVAPDATRPARYDGEDELLAAMFHYGWLRIPFQEVELHFLQ
jgi:hypothetical protein